MQVVTDIPLIRVVAATDYKGNPVYALDVLGGYMLFKEPTFEERQNPERMDAEAGRMTYVMADLLRVMLGRMLLGGFGFLAENGWSESSPTGRDVDYRSPAVDHIEYR